MPALHTHLGAGVALLDDAISGPAGVPSPDAVRPDVAAEMALATREFTRVVGVATQLAVVRGAHLVGGETSLAEARGMLAFTLRTVLAATLVGDDRIVTDHVGWAESVLAGRSRPISLVADVLGQGESSIRLLSESMGDRAFMHPVNVTILGLLLGKA